MCAVPLPLVNDSIADRPLLVGVGASAGGLAAFKTFLTHMPPNSGMAFVLVQHLRRRHIRTH